METSQVASVPNAPASSGTKERAARCLDELKLLASDRVEQAFKMGEILVEWEREGYYAALGHKSQEDVIEAAGLKRATALSNKRLAQKFDRHKHAHLGVGRLRILAANHIENPEEFIEDGIECSIPDGTTKRRSIKDMSYRELQAWSKKLRKNQKSVRVAVDIGLASAADRLFEEPIEKPSVEEAPADIEPAVNGDDNWPATSEIQSGDAVAELHQSTGQANLTQQGPRFRRTTPASGKGLANGTSLAQAPYGFDFRAL